MAMTLAEIRRSKAEWQANYKVAHPDRVRISNCHYRRKLRDELLALANEIKAKRGCAYKDKSCKGKLEFDHKIPRSVVGGQRLSQFRSRPALVAASLDPNIQVLCGRHNKEKYWRSDRWID